ncbi:MAG TPA: DUF885 domain-containing protein [Kofleriaceae bacterium]|jgi:uncharacterized protein (DUF885 family)|nr:DUF885 domain-containing protein [Kofleriaceae bacterium]
MRCSPVPPAIVLACCALACGGSSPPAPASTPPVAPPAPAAPAPAPAAAATPAAPDANAALDALFAEYDAGVLARSPMTQSERGIKTDYGKWDDFSDEQAARNNEAETAALAAMRTRFASATLDDAHRLSYRLFEDRIERLARSYQFHDHGDVFDQMNGAQSRLTAFLINIHKVTSAGDAEAYVQRLQGMGPALRQLVAVSASRAAKGFLPPKWVYPFVVGDARNVIKGAPFDRGPESALLADFKTKVGALKLSADETSRLTTAATAALVESVKPAYEAIIAEMTEQARHASTDDGVWRFPDGADYYATLLKNYTTTGLSAEQIHELGLQQVARIHQEMVALMPALHIRGTLPKLLVTMRDRKDLYYPSGPTGRAMYLAETQKALDGVTAKLPQWFGTLPKAPLVVKPVEAFREKSAGKAFYQRPAADGSRPGTYYVNLYDMAAMPTMEVEALVYHEGIPGHHLQLAVQTELSGLPAFRKFGGVTAYSEGWGLYAEKLAKDMGQYTDPVRDFGRLQLELHRAIRLVVDTGIHAKKWTREQAIRYVLDNSAEPRPEAAKAIERYIVMPGQATAYMVGRLKISELRERARTALADRFDIRAFHEVVLRNGPLPLDLLDAEVTHWIESQHTGAR